MTRAGTEGCLPNGGSGSTARLRAALAGGAAVAILIAALGPAQANLQRKVPQVKREQVATKKEPPPKPIQVPIIAISIGSQRLTVYDNGQPIAHAPVSTGMAGHLTPTGIFSVIQKEVFHRSNIYSGAPMPHMQRITWSGIAMHAGALPGYPASHGCIRLPPDFATKFYNMTRQGARVVISRNELVPVPFENAKLFTLPKPASDKTSRLDEPATTDGNSAGLVRTAEAKTSVMSDAVDAAAHALSGMVKPKPTVAAVAEPPKPVEPAPVAEMPKDAAQDTSKDAAVEVAKDVAAEPVKEDTQEAAKDVAAPVSPVATVDAPTAAPQDVVQDIAKQDTAKDETTTAAKDNDTTTGAVMVKPIAVVPDKPVEMQKTFEATSAPPKVEPPKAEAKPETKPDAKPDAKQAVLEPYGPERPLRPGPITVFVSKKEGKVFIRKAFQPVLSAPVTIARPDLPLGTHIFTASEAKPDGESFRWLLVSMPPEPQKKVDVQVTKDNKGRRIEKKVETTVQLPSATAAEALDRVEIPAYVRARISALMSVGASLIISDQGLGGETGIETDFIVLTH